MTYQEALEKAIQPWVKMGASQKEAKEVLDAIVQQNIDYRNYTASKGNAQVIHPGVEFLCDLKEGKTTEDRDVVVAVSVGNVENLRRFGIPSKGNRRS